MYAHNPAAEARTCRFVRFLTLACLLSPLAAARSSCATTSAQRAVRMEHATPAALTSSLAK